MEKENHLKQLNVLSHKIFKPLVPRKHPLLQAQELTSETPPAPPMLSSSQIMSSQHHQPPVYNISKNDFREVVQKLTGRPIEETLCVPPPVQPPRMPSSRLQRIRPPPLASFSLNQTSTSSCSITNSNPFSGPNALSPLPPLPSVHTVMESPVSAYLRHFHNLDGNTTRFTELSPSPTVLPPSENSSQEQEIQEVASSKKKEVGTSGSETIQPHVFFQFPQSPLPFGCLNSPKSMFPLPSSSLLISPASYPPLHATSPKFVGF